MNDDFYKVLISKINDFSTIYAYNFNPKYKEWSWWVLRENSANTQVNDIKDFEASKLVGSIEWE